MRDYRDYKAPRPIRWTEVAIVILLAALLGMTSYATIARDAAALCGL